MGIGSVFDELDKCDMNYGLCLRYLHLLTSVNEILLFICSKSSGGDFVMHTHQCTNWIVLDSLSDGLPFIVIHLIVMR